MMDVCAGGTVAEWSDCFEDMFYYFWVGEGYDERIYIFFSQFLRQKSVHSLRRSYHQNPQTNHTTTMMGSGFDVVGRRSPTLRRASERMWSLRSILC